MSFFKEIKIELVTLAVIGAGRTLSKLSDPKLARALGALKPLAGDPGMKAGLEEIIDIINEGPPNTDTLRRMLRDSRYDELRDFISENMFFRQMDCEEY